MQVEYGWTFGEGNRRTSPKREGCPVKIPEGRELRAQVLVTAFVLAVVVGVLLILAFVDPLAAQVASLVALVAIVLMVGFRVTARVPGEKRRSD